MRVIVEGGKQEVERITKRMEEMEGKTKEYDELVGGLIEALNTKWNTDEFSEMSTMKELKELDEEFEFDKLKEERDRKPASTGTVSLRSESGTDIIDELLGKEFDTQREMVHAVYQLYMNPDLTSQQKKRLKQAKDKLWAMLKNQPTIPKTIKKTTPYDGKSIFLIKCGVCFQEIPQGEYPEHFNAHVEKAKNKGYKTGVVTGGTFKF